MNAAVATVAGNICSKGRILVVDDDRLVLATVSHGLSQAGYEVIDADNGDDAILLAREHRPALALLDIRMEGKSGFDVAQTLRDAYAIPFMFLSAFADEATRQQVQALGAMDYLIKPLDVGQIVPAVEAAFARLEARSESRSESGLQSLSQARPEGPFAAPPDVPAAHAAVAAESTGTDPVALAVGVLMHRHSLRRDQAWQRLRRMAGEQQLPLAVQAERLLGAVEELARSAL